MRESLGLVETIGLSNAILVADAMSKTANINIIGLENSKGLGYMTIKITGDVGAVNAAVACGKQIAIENNSFVTAKVIPRPANNIEDTFCQLESKKDNVSIEKENNEENIISSENSIKAENEPSNNVIDAKENTHETSVQVDSALVKDTLSEIGHDEVKEVLVEADEKSNEVKESSVSLSSPKDKASNTEKAKTRSSNRKKAGPKNN